MINDYLEYIQEKSSPEQKTLTREIKLLLKELSPIYSKTLDFLKSTYAYLPEEIINDIIRENKFRNRNDDELKIGKFEEYVHQTIWIKSKPLDRRMLYREYRLLYNRNINDRLKLVSKNYNHIKKLMNNYVDKFDEILEVIKDNNETYKSIKPKWYNIFGGIKGSVERYKQMYEIYKKLLTVDLKTFNDSFLQINYLKGGMFNNYLAKHVDAEYFDDNFWGHWFYRY